MQQIYTRQIVPGDNAPLAKIIRTALTEFGADKPGTVYYDDTTDHLYELFQEPGSVYYVAVNGEEIIGGAGIFPTAGLQTATCELVKMYLAKEARGKGIGTLLMNSVLAYAKDYGYKQVYIETMPELRNAVTVYEHFGFKYLNEPLGNSGHFGCDLWMLKTL